MYRRQVTIRKTGLLQGRSAREFLGLTGGFRAKGWIDDGTRRADAGTMIGVLTLELFPGKSVLLLADGPDERELIHAMEAFLLQP